MAKEKKNTETAPPENWIQEKLAALRQDNRFKGSDYNEPKGDDWRVSTGSMILDSTLSSDGREGIGPQIVKIYGDFGVGKTSFLLNIAANFQKIGKNYFVYIVNGEGRITDKLIEQSGISTDPSQYFKDDIQEAEAIFTKIRILMAENNSKPKKDYMHICVLIDSMDALMKKADLALFDEKGFEGNPNPGGNAVISKTFLKSASLPITAGKHLMLLTGQTISIIGAAKNQKKTMPSGGAGAKYFSSTMLEVKRSWTNTKFWDGDKEIGHYFELFIEKTANNQRAGDTVLVPIKRNFPPGKAIWVEVECRDLMLAYSLLKKVTTQSYELDANLIEEMKADGLECESKFRGEFAIVEYLENNPKITEFIVKKLKGVLFVG